VDEEIRFYIERAGNVAGPVTDDEVRDALREGRLEAGTRVRLAGSDLWVAPRVFATFALSRAGAGPVPTAPTTVVDDVPPELAHGGAALLDLLLFWVHEGTHTFGPLTGEQLRVGQASGRYRGSSVTLLEPLVWYPAALVFGREPATSASTTGSTSRRASRSSTIYLGAAAEPVARASSVAGDVPAATQARCAVCLERIPRSVEICPECGEAAVATPPPSTGPASIPDLGPDAGWFATHWRPVVTLGVVASLLSSGVALRYLAPDRFLPPRAAGKPAAAVAPEACSAACWNGEACQQSHCVWQKPNNVGHVAPLAEPTVGGPFPLPKDVTDAIPLDAERFAISLLTGLQLHNARTGGALALVTDAPQSRRLYRVGPVVYATAPQRVFVIDAATTRLLKTIELGAQVGELAVGASGRRVLASLPSAHAVAVIATEYHAEIDRIQFGDDAVGPIGVDDTGKRALTTTGTIPLAGLREPAGGAAYAFDPSRLASEQDRVRAAMVGNPVGVLMAPGGEASWVVLRAEDALVPLEWLPSGALRQNGRIPTCREPEQIELVRRGRLGVLRCNEGRAVEVFDLQKGELLQHIPFNGRVADLAISPDGEQAIVALPAEGSGFIGLIDLSTFAVRMLPVTAEPTRVRIAPDGSMALVLSDRAKVAWVLR
jgi:DNA-binding beta-propeller fold protein YncE